MYPCIATIIAGLVWLLYECDWLRLRMVVGPVHLFCLWEPPAESDESIAARMRLDVARLRAEATNDYKRGGADGAEFIESLIVNYSACGFYTDDVLEEIERELVRVEHEMGERMNPWRNQSRRGHKRGISRNPSAYPYYGISGDRLQGRWDRLHDFAGALDLQREIDEWEAARC